MAPFDQVGVQARWSVPLLREVYTDPRAVRAAQVSDYKLNDTLTPPTQPAGSVAFRGGLLCVVPVDEEELLLREQHLRPVSCHHRFLLPAKPARMKRNGETGHMAGEWRLFKPAEQKDSGLGTTSRLCAGYSIYQTEPFGLWRDGDIPIENISMDATI